MRKPDDNFFFILVMIFTIWLATLDPVIDFFKFIADGFRSAINFSKLSPYIQTTRYMTDEQLVNYQNSEAGQKAWEQNQKEFWANVENLKKRGLLPYE